MIGHGGPTGSSRMIAGMLAILVLGFCLASVVPAMADHGACAGSDSSPSMCGPVSVADSPPIAVPQLIVLEPDRTSPAWPTSLSALGLVIRFQTGPLSPRAPPFSLL